MARMKVAVAVVLVALCFGVCLAQNGDNSSSTEGAAAAPMECPETYTIMKNDTFNGIAESLNIPVPALMEANPQVENIEVILEGNVLQVPCDQVVATEEGPNPADCRATHVVKERETTSIIAECYDVDIAQIREANPSLVNITSLSIDQEILIPPCDGSAESIPAIEDCLARAAADDDNDR